MSLVRVGTAKRLGSDGSKGSSSSGSNRVDAVVSEGEDTYAKAKLPFSTTFHLKVALHIQGESSHFKYPDQ